MATKRVETKDREIVLCAEQLIRDAKARGIKISRDEYGRPYYPLEWHGDTLRICERKTRDPKAVRLMELVKKAKAVGVKGQVDESGKEYFTCVVEDKKRCYIETPTEADKKHREAMK